MPCRLLRVSAVFFLLFALIGACGEDSSASPASILGRWRVISIQDMTVPNSFFWFTMDYVEFRQDGTVLALMLWPPEDGNDIRVNKIAEYDLVGDEQIAFIGSCRHIDPCTGLYTITLKENILRIFHEGSSLELMWVGPPDEDIPPTVVGPSPTGTPFTAKR
jgi:hypothetical protein